MLLSVSIDHASSRPVSTQLYTSLRDLILSGGFAAGDRLPASRTLARDLTLSRTTVIEAFDRLTAEGLIESRVGAGTYVSKALNAERPRAPDPQARTVAARTPRLSLAMAQAVERFGDRSRLPSTARAFTTALPAFDAFPMAQWARLSAKHWRSARDDVMGYGDPFGHPPLRRAIAAHLRANRGINCDAEQIFIVGGAQQAFYLLGTMLLNPGDHVWFENPGAIGARNSLIAAGAELVPIPVDAEGLCVDEGLRLSPQFRLAFVTPSHQQPLGAIMSLARRFALLHAAEQAGAWIVEDDYDGEFSFGGNPLPTLKSVDATGLVIYVGTFSKSLFPSLRLGYLLAPPALVPTLRTIMSKLLARRAQLRAGHRGRIHRRGSLRVAHPPHAQDLRGAPRCAVRRGRPQPRRTARCRAQPERPAHDRAPAARPVRGGGVEGGGMRNITASPIARFTLAPVPLRGLVLGFGGIRPPAIEAGVQVLADVLEQQLRR